MINRSSRFKPIIFNALYLAIVFITSLALATLALTRKINSYAVTNEHLFLNIDKEEILVSNSVTGQVEKVMVQSGDHVKKGDLLINMVDDVMQAKINSLDRVANDNLSAKTESDLLKAEIPQLQIRAPRDGVVYKVNVGEGAYLNRNTELINMYADSDVKLTGLVNEVQFDEIQKNKEIEVYSPRFEQMYTITFTGVGRVKDSTPVMGIQYEVEFLFNDPEEGVAFVPNEKLEVVSLKKQDDVKRPADVIAKFWNSFILGK
jgi:multidrug resistance efflux pump